VKVTIDAVADALFGAIASGDVATVQQLWDDDVRVWHSGDPKDNERARALRVIEWFIETTSTRRYQVLDRRFFDGGFVQQHVLHATDTEGAVIAMRVCIVILVNHRGLITRIDEYFDPREMSALM
jgi:ketosteroid isomerase-like protein